MSDTKPLRLALVGCGLMGAHYADVFSRMDGIVLEACCDPTPSKLEAFARENGFNRTYLDYRVMLADGGFDGVLNVTHDSLHAPVALAALDAGFALMTEKPLATSPGECRAILTAARDTGCPVVVNFSKRNTAAASAARSVMASGLLGDIIRIDASYRQGWVFTRDWGDWETVHAWTWRLNAEMAPQGVLADLGSHMTDLVRYVTGDEISSVTGGLVRIVGKGTPSVGKCRLDSPDIAQASLVMDNGVPVRLLCSRVDTGHRDRPALVVHGSRGMLELDLQDDRRAVKITLVEGGELPDGFLDPDGLSPIEAAASGEARRITVPRPESNYRLFARLAAGESAAAPDAIDGFRAQAVIQAVMESAASGGGAAVPEEPRT